MSLVEKSILLRQHEFILTNQRAMFWLAASALIISDLHLGKTAHFRKNGIALPATLIQEDLRRLSSLLKHFNAKQLFVVGDFLHAGKNSEFEIFKEWKQQFPEVQIILIKGNHDRMADVYLKDLGVSEIHNHYESHDFIFSHENLESLDKMVISGHLHPGISLKSPVGKYLKFPSYIHTSYQFILPAFSSFTGLDTNNHPRNPHYYFFSEDGIYEL